MTIPPMPPPAPAPRRRRTGLIITLSVLGGLVALLLVIGVIAAIVSGTADQAASTPTPVAPLVIPATTAGPGQPSTPQPVDTVPAGSITEQGMLLVGPDIKPGTYAGYGPCYWARLKNAAGELDSILANDNANTDDRVTITVRASDYALQHECGTLIPLAALRTVPASGATSDLHGVLVVGRDIHPGTWRGTATGDCYWARLSGFTGDFGELLANDNVNPGSKFTITIRSSDKGLELGRNCGTLTKV